MPLWEIVLPGTVESKVKIIQATLSLISGGLPLCVQAVLMACDAGHVEPGEEVISMSADTAIVARAAQTRWLFHPERGLEIREIICMPRYCNISRPGTSRKELGKIKEEDWCPPPPVPFPIKFLHRILKGPMGPLPPL